MKFKIYILAFLLSSIAHAQVSFVAKPSKTKLGVNERLRVDFVMNKDGDNFSSPSFENFTVVG
ncbi:MAG: protein BatD, partial [Flavobacteriaceae bacterium]|nr:protein BatD [Flavobacteriaceae bacterium]